MIQLLGQTPGLLQVGLPELVEQSRVLGRQTTLLSKEVILGGQLVIG